MGELDEFFDGDATLAQEVLAEEARRNLPRLTKEQFEGTPMGTLKDAYEVLSEEDKAKFWEELSTALKWRGWDSGSHRGPSAHCATNLCRIADLFYDKAGLSIEEYT